MTRPPVIPPWILIPHYLLVAALAALAWLALSSLASAGPWEEVNAQRAHLGLPPLVRDPALMDFAQSKAQWQAARHVSLDTGGNGHEGPRTPSGCVEGTGCLPASWGWGTCAMRTRGSWPAGAGLAIGSDGKRYMCLVIRCPNGTPESNVRANLSNTAHLSPSPPRIPYAGSYSRRPRGQWYEVDAQAQPCPKCGRIH